MAEFSFTKWGASDAFGTPGGVVTWSLVGEGVAGVDDAFETGGSNLTADPFFLDYDVEATLRRAFAVWSDAADIRFLQVEDDDATIGAASVADIRVSFGDIDGADGDTLGFAFFPAGAPIGGEILLDADEGEFFAEERLLQSVAAHEIGHAIGLDHEDDVPALMNSIIDGDPSLRPDDVEGIQTVYGAAVGGPTVLALTADRRDLTIAEAREDLTVIGTSGADAVTGGMGGEILRGGSGADDLTGRGGADLIRGQAGEDVIRGGGGADDLRGGGGSDALAGGGGEDALSGGGGADALRGGKGADLLRGNAGDDAMKGGNGADMLRGGAGDDTLAGSNGADTLSGGGGADRFVFSEASVADLILDFESGVDAIDLSGRGDLGAFADLRIFDGTEGALVILGSGGAITMAGVAAAELDAGDFIF
ncbi:MAG: matrixin family metalloprotease [Pseudomonadota bacterium]